MPVLEMLNVYRRDRKNRVLITLAGEIDQVSAPLVSAALERCLREGIRTIDVDLTPVTFCDCSGLNAFLDAAHRTIAANGSLRLHHPPSTLTRILTLTGTGPLLLGPTDPAMSPPRPERPAGSPPAPQLSLVHGGIGWPGARAPQPRELPAAPCR
ncbi:STAS domain-containing protein [Streptomyces sp. QH1-20]|uniref:STAS domain-containing protein n=1 Tax=Streptomyces sp. QH1-20 TaxID=3240934 RepID=UPI0035150693